MFFWGYSTSLVHFVSARYCFIACCEGLKELAVTFLKNFYSCGLIIFTLELDFSLVFGILINIQYMVSLVFEPLLCVSFLLQFYYWIVVIPSNLSFQIFPVTNYLKEDGRSYLTLSSATQLGIFGCTKWKGCEQLLCLQKVLMLSLSLLQKQDYVQGHKR